MIYSEGRLTPESNVTQDVPAPKKKQNLKAARREIEALEEANRGLQIRILYRQLESRGWRKGFIYGLLTGAVGVAVLAAVVLGDVIRG
jgi:hypothetical protein